MDWELSSSIVHPGLRVRVVGRSAEELLPLLAPYSVEVLEESSLAQPELVISSGGDGSLLGAERLYPGIPKLPIRDRFHDPRCPLHGEKAILEHFFSGEMAVSRLAKIQCDDHRGHRQVGLNDIVTAREVNLGAIRYRIVVDGQVIRPQVISDSLVVSTPFGSTGYFQSITRGSFRQGIGLAFNNPLEGEDFLIVDEHSTIDVEMLRGPASVMADNDPVLWEIADGQRLSFQLAPQPALVFGLAAFRCRQCYELRRDGLC